MSAPKTFDEWLADYLVFKARAAKIVGQPISSEPAVLQYESQVLEPLRWEAEEHRASAVSRYYAAKMVNAEKLTAAGWPKSSVFEAAKCQANRQLWARMNTEGLCKVIESRAFKIAQHLKLLDGK
jgi:hypothetical protein